MKIVHTADWHLGKLLCGIYLNEDQFFVLEEFFKFLEDEKPDLILLAGDIYDRSYPSVEAVRMLNYCFEKILLELKIPMVIITGNHDHADRLDFGSSLMEKSGLYLRAKIEPEIKPVLFKDEYAEWEIYPIPYADTAMIRNIYQDSEIKNAQIAMEKILEPINQKIRREKAEADQLGKPRKRYIALAHSFFVVSQKDNMNGEEKLPEQSDSERPLSIGGVDAINTDIWQEFDYVALGHLHKPQKVGRDSIRYSGSLLKYSFSEANHQKSMVVLDWKEELDIRLKKLKTKRDLRIVEGTLEEILAQGRQDQARDDYIMAKLTNKEILIDPISDLKGIYPNVLALEYVNRMDNSSSSKELHSGKDFNSKNIWDLFEQFYENVTGQMPDTEKIKKLKVDGGLEYNETN